MSNVCRWHHASHSTSRTENPKLKIKQTIAVIEEALRRSKLRVNQDKTLTILFSQTSWLLGPCKILYYRMINHFLIQNALILMHIST